MVSNILRRVRLAPYRKGMGPTFTLATWDTGRASDNHWMVGYKLTMIMGRKRTVLFQGEDFGCPPLHAIDSDATVAAIMGFLTLKPGDTDAEYFDAYTQEQLDYCSEHAEALDSEVRMRFGDR